LAGSNAAGRIIDGLEEPCAARLALESMLPGDGVVGDCGATRGGGAAAVRLGSA
jgi:hypothetical protein